MSNHAAIIAKVEKSYPIQGAERIHVAEILGEFCIVSKEIDVGDVGVLFPSDLQLSEEYAKKNNLFRDHTMNEDVSKKGFFDNNRKVRAQVFMGTRSTAYFTSLDTLYYTGVKDFKVGDRINVLNGFSICDRYVSENVKQVRENNSKSNPSKKRKIPLFKEHVDSAQLQHFIDSIPEGALLSFHAKKHGTSFRVGYLPVEKKLTLWQRLINKFFGEVIPSEKYELVIGTRRVILKNENSCGYHGSDLYRYQVAEKIKPHLTKGMQVYGEIVGYVNGKSIMPEHDIRSLKDKDFVRKYGDKITYKYGNDVDSFSFHIYRITHTDIEGNIHEWDQKKMENWCNSCGLGTTFEIHPQMIYNGDTEQLKELVNSLTERPDLLCEDYTDPSHISEGIIVRMDYKGSTRFFKNKSIPFKIMEGILTIDDEEDMS